MIIDFHTHTFPEAICDRVLEGMSLSAGIKILAGGSPKRLQRAMEEAGISKSINLPVMTKVEQVEKVNRSMIDSMEAFAAMGIETFGGIHPEYTNYKEELRLLAANGIRGIKIHPAYQGADLDDIRFLRILDKASEEGLIVVTHAGIDIGLSDHDYASVAMVRNVLKEVAPTKLVLAHMGGWANWKEVEEELAGAPIWLDTAFSLGELSYRTDLTREQQKPRILEKNLDAESFVRLAKKHGADKILFATDSPWGDMKTYRSFVEESGLTPEEREMVFHQNALKLLG